MSADNTTFKPGLARVAEVAVLGRPCDLTVVAHAAELAGADIVHSDDIGARPHLESKLVVADFASKSDAMKPMWEYYGSNTARFGPAIENYIGILRLCESYDTGQERKPYDQPKLL